MRAAADRILLRDRHRSPRLVRLLSALVSRPTPSIDAQSFRRGARERAFAHLIRLRLVIAPVLGAIAFTFALFEPTPWRRALLGTVILLLLTISTIEWIRYKNRGIGALMVPLNLFGMMLGQLAMVTATGGLFSPVVPAVILMVVAAAILVERPTIILSVTVFAIPTVWALCLVHVTSEPVPSLVPRLFGDPGQIEHGVAPWIAATVYTGLFLVASRVGAYVRGIFEDLFDEAIGERDRTLAMHAEQTRALTALSSELAHELKNPLASVKGLAALVAKSAEGKPAERLGVLRREVDRMQEILEELLNFSRPLVPLAMEDVDLGELARDVARLHEATAADRAVTVEVRADAPVELRCDPRKVRQVVINLVQNALDASAAGDAVELVVTARRGLAHVRVQDRGPGVPATLAERIFEPGVTTKEHGSGLGLVVARGLARQHGGDLLLASRDGGGTIAELTLPLEPPA